MSFAVFLTDDAAADLEELYDYLDTHTVDDRADYVHGEIKRVFQSLDSEPDRGSFPKELLALGIRDFREIYFKPYRIIYRVIEDRVYVLVIADGRRDMQALLQRRLLQS